MLIASIFFVFFIGECLARYIIKAWPFEPNTITFPHLTSRDKNLRWRFSPQNGLNSLGLRNREIGRKEEYQYRILYLGDSMIWTGETTSGELYTKVIERNLNEELRAQDKKIEVINAGIPGYTTYQELEFLKVYGLDMQPDLVILGFVFNDLYYKYLSKPTEKTMLGREPRVQLYRFNTSSFPGVLFAKSYLAHRLFYTLEILIKKIRGYPYFPFEYRTDFCLAWKDYGWSKTKALIGEMQELLKDRNIQLMVIIYPISDQVDDTYLVIDKEYVLYPQKRIKRICNDYHIRYLDLTEPLYRKGGTKLYKDYLHLNNKGNDIVASEVTRYLIDNTLIK